MKLSSISGWLLVTLILLVTVLVGACSTPPTSDPKMEQPPTPAATASNAKLAEPSTAERPLFSGRIANVSMYPVPNKREDLAISLVVSITNAGLPSTAPGWKLEVSSPGGGGPTNLEPVHVNGVVEMPGSAGKKVDLGKEDLAVKTVQMSISKGVQIDGVLTFVLPRSSEKELTNNSTRLVVHFKDSQGHSYSTPAVVVGAKAGSGK